MKGSALLVRCTNRPNVASLREIAAGKVHFDRPSADAIEEWIQTVHNEQERELDPAAADGQTHRPRVPTKAERR
jgi:hypothetical protein